MRFLVLFLYFLTSSLFASNDVEFVVVIPSYNNAKYIEQNLASVFIQDYPHWQLIYINDCSTDNTGQLATELIKKYNFQKRCHVINNLSRCGAMANIFKGAHLAHPKKVVVLLDGDDELKDSSVLSYIAKVYKDKNVWMTYGNYEAVPNNLWTNDPCTPIPEEVKANHSYRTSTFIYYPLRTFYAKLFHLIKLEHLQWKGQFLPVVSDTGYMIPMLEMASNGHIKYIDKVLYTYHVDNPINDFRTKLPLMEEISSSLRQITPYKPLKKLF